MKGPLRPGAWSQADDAAAGGLASRAGLSWDPLSIATGDVDRHSLMLLMRRPDAVVGAVCGFVAGSCLSLGWQAALKPLTREVILVRPTCFPPGVPGGVELAPSSE